MNRNKIIFVLAILLLTTMACGIGQQDEPPPPTIAEDTAIPELPAAVEPMEVEEPTAVPGPTEAAEPVEVPDLTADNVTFENERFILKYPDGWFSDALAGLGFFATDVEIQNTWYTDQGPFVEDGAAVIALVGSREELDIGPEVSALEATNAAPDEDDCEITGEPAAVKINGNDAATVRFVCSSGTDVETIAVRTMILMEDRAAILIGLVAANSKDELQPVVEAIINSFQFASASSSDATSISGGPGWFGFVSNRDGNVDIYLMKIDGSEIKRLTDHPEIDNHVTFSPDGKKIAFASDRDGNTEIYVMNADGSEQTNLSNNPGGDWPYSWSPDGKKIAFISDRDGNYDVYVMNADGSEPNRLTDSPEADSCASAWSPDGKKIAWTVNNEIYVMNIDGSEPTRLTDNSAQDFCPTWSPDGKKIAFTSDRDGNEEVYLMNPDGSEQTRLTDSPASDSNPAWSPNDSLIIFNSDRDGNSEIYVMNIDGSDPTRVTKNTEQDYWPRLQPGTP